MKAIPVFLTLFFVQAALYGEGDGFKDIKKADYAPSYASAVSTVQLNGYVSFWIQKSSGTGHSLPAPFKKNVPVKAELAVYDSEGYVDFKIFETAAGQLSLKAKFYSVCPYAAKGKCEGLYFGAEAELKGGSGAFCGGYFNEKDFLPFPVFFCSGYSGRDRLGVTFHREKY
ncbi:MAG: hypothetical protein COT17_07270 [Elusimicrobia bacterium CG08_land_8_20_14_0_20_51_18]|nr:MAG: hypothetical protein COT17_07270 [Elusimicrobia bacterium CG08_land_8_20_14_0_20_51_18]